MKYIQVIDKLSEITKGTLELEAFGGPGLILVSSVEDSIRYARAQIAQNNDPRRIP